MARIIGAIASSHTPTIGFAVDRGKRDDPVWEFPELIEKVPERLAELTQAEYAAKAIAEPDIRERFASFGYAPWPLSPAQTSAAMEADVRRYADTTNRLNLQLD